jgi:hypothetical protein
LLTAAAVLAASATAAATSKEYVLKHPKHEHCKSHYVKKTKTVRRKVHGHVVKVRETVCVHATAGKPPTSPPTSSAKVEECESVVSGTGPVGETGLYAYQVILICGKGTFGSFQVSTNRAITAGTITATIGSRYTYTCTQTSSTSFSCSGVTAAIPSNEAPPVRASFKSAQPVCVGGTPESATLTMGGATFTAKIGEAQSSC